MKEIHSDSAALQRRPINARRLVVFHTMARALAARRVSPNAISIAGLACAAGAAACLALTEGVAVSDRVLFFAAACLIQLRLLANLLDGMVAVECNRRSPSGDMFNEVPDRISDAAILSCAGYATGSSPLLGWLAALLAMFVAYVRVFGRSQGLSADFCGPMAKQQRMFLITIASVLMAALPANWLSAISLNDHSGPMGLALVLIVAGCVVTAVRRLWKVHSGMMNAARGA